MLSGEESRSRRKRGKEEGRWIGIRKKGNLLDLSRDTEKDLSTRIFQYLNHYKGHEEGWFCSIHSVRLKSIFFVHF